MAFCRVLTGNQAISQGARLCRPQVIAIYPITPQSEIAETMAGFTAEGELDARIFRVESEHSALSIVIGAEVAGARAFTATSSNGLFYMHEMLHYASGLRLPIVMAVANRASPAPWNIWGDHSDSISQRDTGWLQVYVENCQEALDTVIQAYRIAEDRRVSLPIMVCLDGFTLTHVSEGVDIPPQDVVDEFLPPYDPEYSLSKLIERDETACFSPVIFPETSYMEYKYLQAKASERSKDVIREVDREFERKFNRKWGGLIENYHTDDADYILVTLGSLTTTARAVVDELREDGWSVGLIKLRFYRPFPEKELVDCLQDAKIVGVLDRNFSYGYAGAVYSDLSSAIDGRAEIVDFIGGLGGRELNEDHFRYMFRRLKELSTTRDQKRVEWIGLKMK